MLVNTEDGNGVKTKKNQIHDIFPGQQRGVKMNVEEPDPAEPAGTLTKPVQLGNQNACMISHQNQEHVPSTVNKQADLPFYLPGKVGEFIYLVRGESRRTGVYSKVKPGKGL